MIPPCTNLSCDVQVAKASGGGSILSAAAPSEAHMPHDGPGGTSANGVKLTDLYIQLGAGLGFPHSG